MNIQREEEALQRLPPQKYTIRILIIAVVSVATALSFVFGILLKSKNTQVVTQQEVIRIREIEKAELNNRLVDCEQQAREREKISLHEQVEYERERSRQKDSITMALLTARRALKNAK